MNSSHADRKDRGIKSEGNSKGGKAGGLIHLVETDRNGSGKCVTGHLIAGLKGLELFQQKPVI